MEYNFIAQLQTVDQSFDQLYNNLMCLARRRPYCNISTEQQVELINAVRLELQTVTQELNDLNRMGQIMQTRTQQQNGQRTTLMFINHRRLILKQKMAYLNLKKLMIEAFNQ